MLNRASAKAQIFDDDNDYEQFEQILETVVEKEERAIELATQTGSPFGNPSWINKMVQRYHLESALRFPGRPKNGG